MRCVYKDFIHPDNIRYYDEEKLLIAVACRIWVSKMIDSRFVNDGYEVVKYEEA
jgi:hypothetical protein